MRRIIAMIFIATYASGVWLKLIIHINIELF